MGRQQLLRKANGESVREVISGGKETVEEVQLFTIQQKMRTEMLKDVDRKVSDEEAASESDAVCVHLLIPRSQRARTSRAHPIQRKRLRQKQIHF